MDTESQSDSTLCWDWGCCPDDILILTCNHNLWLMWASKNLKNESLKSQHTFQTVVWNTWGLATVLDPESATTLISMFDEIDEENNTPNHNMKSYEIIESPPSKYSRKNVIERTNEFKREPENYQKKYQKNTLQQNKNLYWAEHTEELINYFCFQWNCSNIWAECVIHGSHKGHDVQTIKKAYPIIWSKLEDLKSNVNSKIEEIVISQNKLYSSK